MSPDAAQRNMQGTLSLGAVERVISTQTRFQFPLGGVPKTGFYDSASHLFVGSAGDTITTVIPDATPNHVDKLNRAVP